MLTGWTGLGVSALAQAGRILQDEAFTARAIKGMDFILTRLRRPDGSLTHAYLDGPSSVAGFSEDYAGAVGGLIDLYESTGDVKWLKSAHELQEKELEILWDKEDGGFFDGAETPGLFHRVKSMDESTELAASTASTGNMQRLSSILGLENYRTMARSVVERYCMLLSSTPAAFLRLAKVAEATLAPPLQIVISGSDTAARKPFLTALARHYTATASILYLDGGEGETYIKSINKQLDVPATGSAAAVHICRGGKLEKTCASPAELETWLKATFTPPPVQ